ncbi:hypothetical protein [Micromonospora sp. NPDC048830]|uniref:hypothetical protein n=1 Tax=Micromonospora sp. NPDC048830 TaxID=3364257 RepID=UPI003715910A
MTQPARVYVQDHGFFLTDRDVDTPFETMDYATGLAGVMRSAALVYAGVDRGYITVTTYAADASPPLDTPQQWADLATWEDIAEFSLHVPHGALTVAPLERRPSDAAQGPSLSPHGPGHYRIRIYASGRDHHFDQAVSESGERFHLVAWPAPPQGPVVIKSSSRCGYGLRLAALASPPRTEPITPLPQDQAEVEYQSLLRQNLLSNTPEQP